MNFLSGERSRHSYNGGINWVRCTNVVGWICKINLWKINSMLYLWRRVSRSRKCLYVIITILLDNFEVQRILNVIPNIKLRKVVISLSLIIYLYSVHYTIRLLIFFHNLRGYDSHLIFQTVTSKHGRINIIANNSEKSIWFSIGKLKFLDSMQFLFASSNCPIS